MSELNRLSNEEFHQAEKHPVVIVLDNVRSTLNVGSVFRTADAFLVEEIHLAGLTPIPNREMNKTALGATESVTWKHFDHSSESLNELKKKGYTLLAVEQTDSSIKLQDLQRDLPNKMAFVFGHEVEGVSNESLDLCDAAVEIPQFGTKHSLNISVSAGIVLWEASRSFISKRKSEA